MFFFNKKYQNLSDLELLCSIRKNGSNKCSSVLFERYAHLVFGVCLNYLKNEFDSKDAVIEIFDKALVYLKTNDVTNFKSWIYSTSKNYCLMQIRSKTADRKKEEAYKLLNHEEVYDVNKEQKLQLLEEQLKHLSPQQQSCIQLFYFEKKSYAQIVATTGYDLKEVKSHIQNAKRNLKINLEKQNVFNT